MRKTGLTLQAIAHRVGLSKERVRQIIKGHQPPVKPPLQWPRQPEKGKLVLPGDPDFTLAPSASS